MPELLFTAMFFSIKSASTLKALGTFFLPVCLQDASNILTRTKAPRNHRRQTELGLANALALGLEASRRLSAARQDTFMLNFIGTSVRSQLAAKAGSSWC